MAWLPTAKMAPCFHPPIPIPFPPSHSKYQGQYAKPLLELLRQRKIRLRKLLRWQLFDIVMGLLGLCTLEEASVGLQCPAWEPRFYYKPLSVQKK